MTDFFSRATKITPQAPERGQDFFARATSLTPAPQQPVQTSVIGDFLRGAGDTALFSFADEAEAAARSLVGPESFGEELQQARAKHEAAGPAFFAGMGAGALVPGFGVAGVAARGATTAAKLGRAALGGGVAGGIGGFGAGEGGLPGEEAGVTGRLPSAAFGAAVGAPLGAAGERIGAGLSKFAQRRLARDIDKLDPGKVADLQRKAQAQGIQLTPAEATNLPSLKAQQKALGNLTETADELQAFAEGRAADQIEPAVNNLLERISPIEGAEVAGLQGRAAAQQALDKVAANRAKQARPIYQKAFAASPAVDTRSVLKSLRDEMRIFPKGGEVRKKLSRAANLITRSESAPQRTVTLASGETLATPTTTQRLVPETDLARLHSAKLEIDQMINAVALDKRLGPTTKAKLTQVRQKLKKAMETASGDYAAATNIYADLTPGVARVREGITGVIADLPDTNVRLAASKLFNPATSGPVLMRQAKRQIQDADPQAWQALKRAWVEEQWLRAGKETLEGGPRVNRGALFRKALLGDQKQKRMLQEAMEPEEFKALTDLSDVLEASGRVKSIGSDTAWNQELMRAQRQGASSILSRTLKLTTPDALKTIAERWDERRLAQQSQQLVSIITSPDGVQMMRELKRLPARDVFKRSILAQMLTSMTTTEATQAAAPLEVDIFPSDRNLPAQPEPAQ